MNTSETSPSPSERILGAGLQRIDVKIPVAIRGGLAQDDVCDRLIAVFGRWRTEEGEEIVDLQDYSHVADGPGVVLVSKRWVLSVDFGAPGPGVLLSIRKGLDGALEARCEEAVRQAYHKAVRLAREKELADALTIGVDTLLVRVNDRLLFPNTDRSADDFVGPLKRALERVTGGAPDLERESTPAGRLGFAVTLNVPGGATAETLAGG